MKKCIRAESFLTEFALHSYLSSWSPSLGLYPRHSDLGLPFLPVEACHSQLLPVPQRPTDLVFHLFRISIGEGKSSLD